MSFGCAPQLGWITPPGGGGVDSVNGKTGVVVLDGTDLAYTPTYATAGTTGNTAATVADQLLWSETRMGTASFVWGEPTLEAAAPEAAGTHTFNRPAIMLAPLGGAPIGLQVNRDVDVVHPGSIDALGTTKVLLTGSIAGPLVKGEVSAQGLSALNMSGDPAARDLQIESLAGRAVVSKNIGSFGVGGIVLENINGPASFLFVRAPPAGPADGIIIDQTIVSMLLEGGISQSPAGGGHNAVRVEDTATVVSQLLIRGQASITQDPTDHGVSIGSSASLPGGAPFPTSTVGVQIFNATTQGPGALYDPSGIGAADARVFSLSHQNGQRSNWLGIASYESIGTPPDAQLDHAGFPDTPLVVPWSNAGAGGTGATLRELDLTASAARHTLVTGTVAIATVSAGGTYTGLDGDYPATQASTSGAGTGAEFTVTLTAGAITAVVPTTGTLSEGSGYVLGDTITLAVVGPTETVAAVLAVANEGWHLLTVGPVGGLTGPIEWFVDHERSGGAGSTVFGYMQRRVGGVGPWVEVDGSRSIPQAALNSPQRADGGTELDDVGSGDLWRIVMVNDNANSTVTLFTIIRPFIEGQP